MGLHSEQQMFLDLQRVIDDENVSDKLALSNTIQNSTTFDEKKRPSLETINSNLNNNNEVSAQVPNLRIKSHSAIIRKNNKNNSSKVGISGGPVET